MCGFCGFIIDHSQYDSNQSKKILFEMNNALAHRGPDEEGYEILEEEQIFLGHKRLSILDLNKRNNQPFIDKSNQISLVFNGEMYDSNISNDTAFLGNGLDMFGFSFIYNTDFHGSL